MAGFFCQILPARALMIIQFLRPIGNIRECYSKSRRNYKNKMLCNKKVIVIFVGGAFSRDTCILTKAKNSYAVR